MRGLLLLSTVRVHTCEGEQRNKFHKLCGVSPALHGFPYLGRKESLHSRYIVPIPRVEIIFFLM